MKPKKPPRKYGYVTAPVQFERWCQAYLHSSLERSAVYNPDDRRLWARRATAHIMRRLQTNAFPRAEDV